MKFITRYFTAICAALAIWVSQDFNTLQAALDFMNKLPADSGCYVISLNSTRSNAFNGYYSVIYKK